MAYQILESNDGRWAVDWEVIRRIVHSYCVIDAINRRSQKVEHSGSNWYNPFSWNLPESTSIEVDWDTVSSEADTATDSFMGSITFNARGDFKRELRYLRQMQRKTRTAQRKFQDSLKEAQGRTMRAVRKAVDDYDTIVAGAKLTRDASASTLLIGASVISGGAATAALAVGSGLKGTAKYQDTGNIGAATMEVAGSVIFTLIPIKTGAMGTGEKIVLVLTEAVWEGSTAVIEGKSIVEAAAAGSLKIIEPAVGAVIESRVMSDSLQKWALPALAKVIKEDDAVLMTLIAKEAEMFGKMALGKGHGAAAAAMFSKGRASAPPPPQNRTSGSKTMRAAAAFDRRLLDVSAIDMERGITVGTLLGISM